MIDEQKTTTLDPKTNGESGVTDADRGGEQNI